MSKTTGEKLAEVAEWLGTGSINLFGMPGARVAIQASNLGYFLAADLVDSGDILRHSPLPPDIEKMMQQGELVPTPVFNKFVLPYLGQTAIEKPLVLNSVGRRQSEELGTLEATEDAGHPMKVVTYLEITEMESFRRLEADKRSVANNTPEIVRARFDAFETETASVLGTYEKLGLLVVVDAMPHPEQVLENITDQLYDKATSA